MEGTFLLMVVESTCCLGAGQSLVLTHTDHWLSSMFYDAASQRGLLRERKYKEAPMSVLLQQGVELGCGSGGLKPTFQAETEPQV